MKCAAPTCGKIATHKAIWIEEGIDRKTYVRSGEVCLGHINDLKTIFAKHPETTLLTIQPKT